MDSDDDSAPLTPPRFRLTVPDNRAVDSSDLTFSPLPTNDDTPSSFPLPEYTSELAFLSQAFINERFSPELLPFAENVVTNSLELIEYQESEISEVPSSTDHSFIQMLKSMELERVKYILRCYLRTRLQKLEKYAFHFSLNPSEIQHALSKPEKLYLQRYHLLLRTHLYDSALKHLPSMWQSLDEQSENLDMVPKPPLHVAVFVRVVVDVGDIHLPEDREPITMLKGELYLLRYIGIRDLLLQGKVELL